MIRTIPKTRWWMWRPPGLTLPGHQDTLGLRISRVLMRMKPKETRKPSEEQQAGALPGAAEVALAGVELDGDLGYRDEQRRHRTEGD